jgi:hypothetical protein
MVLGPLFLGIKWSDREALTILLYLSPSLRVNRVTLPLPLLLHRVEKKIKFGKRHRNVTS